MKIINSSHKRALLILETIKENPAQNLHKLSKTINIPECQLSPYTQTLLNKGWIMRQQHNQEKLHIITENGRIACICLEFLTTGFIPEGVEIIEEE